MGGYCYYLGPEGPRILGYLEHPVDSRQSGFEKGRELALADLPPELIANVPPARFPPPHHDWEWLWRPPEPTPFRAPAPIWSRVRRFPALEIVLEWDENATEPRMSGAPRDYKLAWAQAERVARYLTSTT